MIGATWMETPETDEGTAFIYFGRTTWAVPAMVETADVIIDNPVDQAAGYFGASVTTGDLNGDGYGDLILGAYSQDNPETDEGNAYMFFGKPSWPPLVSSADVTFDNPDDQADSRFGISVAATPDLNGDGLSDLLVGANFHDTPESLEGAAFLYYGRLTWISTIGSASVTFDNPVDQASGQMGAIGGSGDLNGDGLADVAVGALRGWTTHRTTKAACSCGSALPHGPATSPARTSRSTIQSIRPTANSALASTESGRDSRHIPTQPMAMRQVSMAAHVPPPQS